MSLREYRRKRKFERTPEPAPKAKKAQSRGPLRFVVQKHDASRTHYDFRLELDGALKSWAVPKGPSLTSQDPRLAVQVEDHPLEYGDFEGVIPKGNYGAGTVMVWDAGTYVERGSKGRRDSEIALRRGLTEGHITFVLKGEKLRGEFALVKIKKKGAPPNGWLLIKKQDSEASRRDILRDGRSVTSGRSMEEISDQASKRGEIWLPRKGRVAAKPKPHTTMPRKIRPMEPVFVVRPSDKELSAESWIHEPFGRGIRAIAEVEKGSARLYSRSLLRLETKYPPIVAALKKIQGDSILDGEIIIEGKSPTYVVSDLLYCDGADLRSKPLEQRKKRLERLELPPPIFALKNADSPFIVAKRLDSPYRSGLSRDWLRFKSIEPTSKSKRRTATPSDLPPRTHTDKLYWPEEGYTKGDLLRYYETVSNVILPHLIDRPQSLHRQPDGIRNEGFFHKDMSSFLPRRIETVRVVSSSSSKTINYALCQDLWSLLYLVNLGCIELNPWLSRRNNLDRPEMVVIDLDPDGNDFDDVIRVAMAIHSLLKRVKAESFCKTSGASGLHICIPTGGRYDYETGRTFAQSICEIVQKEFPGITSLERTPAKRRKKIYLDYLQNRRGQTLAAPYCVRPRPHATVSAPLKWAEVRPGLRPEAFTIRTMPRRVAKLGDLWKPLLTTRVDLKTCTKQLSKILHK